MDDNPATAQAPAGWLEVLARSEAQLAAGHIVPGDVVMRELRDSIARLETRRADEPRRGTVPRR